MTWTSDENDEKNENDEKDDENAHPRENHHAEEKYYSSLGTDFVLGGDPGPDCDLFPNRLTGKELS